MILYEFASSTAKMFTVHGAPSCIRGDNYVQCPILLTLPHPKGDPELDKLKKSVTSAVQKMVAELTKELDNE